MNYFDFNLIIQACVGIIIIGVFFSLRSLTKLYGGIIGKAVQLFGLGTLFVTLAIIERLLVDLQVIQPHMNLVLAQHIFDLLGLACLGWGFSKLAAGTQV